MSIKTEIDRIKQSKADIISALTTKGVTVPSDASIDDLSALVEAIEVASDPVLQTKSATPKTSSQTISPDSGYDGLSKVTISAVTSSIDSDIKASNIKKGVNILGVTGTLESGITPTGTMSITSNGTYDVTNYASASVNVSGGGGSGGTTLETCDVTINANYYNGVLGIGYTTVENGVVSTSYSGQMTSSSTTISNVLRGSAISILYSVQYSYDISTENATYITELGTEMFMYTLTSVHLFKAPTTSQTGVITITDED